MASRYSIETIFRAVDRMTGPVSRIQRRIGRFTKSAEMGMRRLDRAMGRVSRVLRTGLRRGAILAGTAITATMLALNGLAAEGDQLAKQSRRIEFPIEELQAYTFVAEQAGIESKQFSGALDFFSKSLGEARAGTGAMNTMLRRMNPQLLRQMQTAGDTAEAFDTYVKAIRSTEDPNRRAAMAAAAFGRSAGTQMVNMANMSADAIERLRKEQFRNGVMTMEQAEAAEAYNDAIGSLKRALNGFRMDVLVPLMPHLTAIAERMREWTIANREIISGRVLGFFRDVRDNFDRIVTWLRRIGVAIAVWVTFTTILKGFILVMTAVNLVMAMNPIGLIVIAVAALIVGLIALGRWLWSIRDRFEGVFDMVTDLAAKFFVMINPIGLLTKAAFSLLRGWEPFDKLIDGIAAKLDKVRAGAARVGRFFGFGGSDDDGQPDAATGATPQMVTPQERVVRSMDERRVTERGEVVIRDETGRAEDRTPPGMGVLVVSTGAM